MKNFLPIIGIALLWVIGVNLGIRLATWIDTRSYFIHSDCYRDGDVISSNDTTVSVTGRFIPKDVAKELSDALGCEKVSMLSVSRL